MNRVGIPRCYHADIWSQPNMLNIIIANWFDHSRRWLFLLNIPELTGRDGMARLWNFDRFSASIWQPVNGPCRLTPERCMNNKHFDGFRLFAWWKPSSITEFGIEMISCLNFVSNNLRNDFRVVIRQHMPDTCPTQSDIGDVVFCQWGISNRNGFYSNVLNYIISLYPPPLLAFPCKLNSPEPFSIYSKFKIRTSNVHCVSMESLCLLSDGIASKATLPIQNHNCHLHATHFQHKTAISHPSLETDEFSITGFRSLIDGSSNFAPIRLYLIRKNRQKRIDFHQNQRNTARVTLITRFFPFENPLRRRSRLAG